MLTTVSTRATAGGAIAFTAISSYFALKKLISYSRAFHEKDRKERLIIITGCDTGLGYSMAVWASKLGYKVLATCLNENGEGAQKLKRQFNDQIIIYGLNVTDYENIENFQAFCREVLETSVGKLRKFYLAHTFFL